MKTVSSSLAAMLAALCAPAWAFAQGVVPPTGEPPPPEQWASEQAALEKQTHDAMAREREQEIVRTAEAEVEWERRAAWEKRGRDLIPPAVESRYPLIEWHLMPRIDLTKQHGIGSTLSAKLRIKRWGTNASAAGWGVEAAGGYYAFRDLVPRAGHTTAAIVEPSVFLWLGGGNSAFRPDHLLLRVGAQNLIPLTSPTPVSFYIAPFAALGFVFGFRPIAKGRGFIGLGFDLRYGGRFAIGGTTPIEGSYVEMLMGLAMGI